MKNRNATSRIGRRIHTFTLIIFTLYCSLDFATCAQIAAAAPSRIKGYIRRIKHSSSELESKVIEPKICTPSNSTDETLWIAMPAWNETKGLERCLQSIQHQVNTGFANVHVVVFEDYSIDMFTEAQKKYYQDRMSVTFLSNNGQEKYGSAYGKWKLFEYIRSQAMPYEYTLIVDGDDSLADEHVIAYVYKRLKESKAWFAWGRHNGKYSEQCKPIQWKLRTSVKTIRNSIWSFCHPRMFQTHLLQHLEEKDFQRDDGNWLQKATDRPFIFKFMEMAGLDRIKYIGDQKALYNYTFDSRNGLKVFKKEVIQGDKELINNRPPSLKQNEVIHVISCIYKRKNSREFFNRLAMSKLPPGHELRIHICNNSPERQNELTSIANDVVRASSDKLSLSIDVENMGGNQGGFARFLLAQKIIQKEPGDYIIMIDDDQYVRKDTIAELYKKRQPMTYKTWFGKTWRKNDKDYWNAFPFLISRPSQRAGYRLDVTHYQYGGTGMSIIDASIFLYKELYSLEEKYKFLEDMWLSHIVNKQGWEIIRLFLFFDEEYKESVEGGQFNNLHSIKNEFFAKLNYFQCRTGKGVGEKIDKIFENETRHWSRFLKGFLTKVVVLVLLAYCLKGIFQRNRSCATPRRKSKKR
ncbi:hypothetical protein CTEN210_16068 [Chaetoceros tenuissimus]|uniref:Glycosyltransferase 2-like domain-containing protein n=1 Tax=Chaetoceros tenuissimus TaxID=426638 RepID=A0AAD3D7Z0_9STRA|nr:hypothetical protein CTEN210_16068 [Chaetoceros tenuissimus]